MSPSAERRRLQPLLSALLAIGVLGASGGAPRAVHASDPATIDAYLRARMAESGIPGMAVALVEDGATVYSTALGTSVDGTPMTVETPVVIGSVGKSFTALAVGQLASAGSLELDAPLTRYVPWFSLDAPQEAIDAVTVRSLLDHTSGLSTADGQDPHWYEPGLTPEAVARGLASVRPDRPAGSHEYSNLNYVLLGVLVEAISGQAYGSYLADHVFGPLGMRSSSAAASGAPGEPTGHRYLFGLPVATAEPYPTGMVPAGYHVSTADDLARFTAALAAGGVRDGIDVVTGRPGTGPAPALGTDWQPMTGASAGAASGQSGSTLTTNADILVEPGARRGVVVVANANPTQLLGMPFGASDIALDVLRLHTGGTSIAASPSVRSVYLVVDLVLVALAGILAIHAWRARTWPRRWRSGERRRALAARALVADLVLPLVVLLGLPVAVGATGSSHGGDVVGGWRFVLWTLPDLGAALLVLCVVPLAIGGWKLLVVRRADARARDAPA